MPYVVGDVLSIKNPDSYANLDTTTLVVSGIEPFKYVVDFCNDANIFYGEAYPKTYLEVVWEKVGNVYQIGLRAKDESSQAVKHKCNCKTFDLVNFGCKCGGV